ncbi:hypothetical protein VitviT2T_010797 [Vitis vinifera]|uniref:non-specific serine/threonine protein kinase n=2 Tax=Vitis vinifera TaxID=29760 RepID=A0ABY9C8V3_VITVI|nr:nodulation receptor kinase [Vitis vinifera]WJZ91752.1 hypothetical protein VitviT2T_010797 [Vitis vinifera]
MMGGFDSWISRSVECLILSFFLLLQSTCAQQAFVSIRCCAESTFTEPSTNISWIPDDGWYSNTLGCQNINKPVENYQGDKIRIFKGDLAKKWCYNLSTTKGHEYLIRGTFLFGDSVRTSLAILFNVSIGVTPIGLVNGSDDSVEVEGVFTARNHHIDFCLLKGTGDPYIYKLELRPLNVLKYLQGGTSSVLKLVKRVDVGNTGEDIRYPVDPNDRIWKAESSSIPSSLLEKTPPNPISSSANVSITTAVPLQVLQTALNHSERLEFLHNDLDIGEYNYNLSLYFLEFIESVDTGQRVFDIYINNVRKQPDFDIMADGSKYREAAFRFTANGSFNLTLVKVSDKSLFGPICNAYEILQVRPWVQETNGEDVNVIMKVKDELLKKNQGNKVLGSWSGDPCLPLVWHGLICNNSINNSPVITELDLSSSGLQGSLPASIVKLAYLEKLKLSDNKFTGVIPEFPASSMLISLDLRHNDLMGKIQESLISLPQLAMLCFGCNPHFDRELPSNFNSTKVTTDYGNCADQGSSHSAQGILIGTVAGGSFLFTIAVGIVFVCFYRQKLVARGKFHEGGYPLTKNAVFSLPSIDDIVFKSIDIQNFTLEYIEIATNKYKTLIGEGGFGSVYRGTLPDGQEVAVKVRSATSTQGTREFENELNLLSAIQHENLVPLLGYCCEYDQQILVYPFMSNGSLQDRLYGEAAKRKTLDWPTRLSIALGAARGLTYLHTFAGRSVIHRDVKSSNILMDHNMSAKVADFGFSKYAPQEGDSGVSLEVRGTAGYLDPEYYSTQHLSAKSDVFSYGVVLLEIISGREPLNIHRPRNEWSLVEWAKPYIRDSKIEEIVDPSIKGGYHAEAMWRVVEVALACIEPYSAYRPCMVDIVRELEDALIIENNASEYMKSIDSFGGSNRFSIEKIERKVVLPPTPTLTDPSPDILQALTPPQPR